MGRKKKSDSREGNEIENDEKTAKSNLPGARDLAHHLGLISAAKQRKSDADMKLASAYSAAEECGLDKKAIKLLLKIRDQDKEKTKAEFSTAIQYMQWMKMPVGSQLHFFDEPTTDPENNAFEEGQQAGLEGASANVNPWPENSKLYPHWERGRMDTQSKMAANLNGSGGKVADLKTERKKRGPKPKGGEATLQ